MPAPRSSVVMHRMTVLMNTVRVGCRTRRCHTLRAIVTVMSVMVVIMPRVTWGRRRARMAHRRRAWIHNGASDRETDMHAGLCPPGCRHQQKQAKNQQGFKEVLFHDN